MAALSHRAALAQDVPSIPETPATGIEGGSGEVQVGLEKFGVGGLARPGDWVGLRIKFLDSAPKQREIIVRVAGVDPDGDTPLYQREFTSNPGVWQGAWMYLRLPFWFRENDPLEVTVHEAVEARADGATTDVSATGYTAGRLLGSGQVMPPSPQALVDTTVGLMAIVGNSTYGLGRYGARIAGEPWSPLGHELLEIAPRLQPDDIPDRWQGLLQFDLIVWGGGDPGELRGDKAKALREWVERGGHLVIILPPVGETWTNRVSNELFDLLPAVSIVRREAVDLEPYRALLTRKKPLESTALPKNAVVHELRPLAEAAPEDAIPILNGPDGQCVVARRLVGAGAVTLLGIDASQKSLVDFDLLDPDIFWHRVLGRRGQLPTSVELTEEQNKVGGSISSRQRMPFDADIGREIAKTGRSAAGVLMGVGLFLLYWAVAGPVGYAVLKKTGRVRHAWLAYLATAGLFTAIAWGGATALKPGRVEGTHLTLLDHVFGMPLQRSRTWASILIPRYGVAALSVGEPGQKDDTKRRGTNLIAAFDPPWASEQGAAMFPDTRGYVVDTRRPDTIVVPTRSTVKQIQADWSGGPRWEMPRPIRPKAPEGTKADETPPKLELDENRRLKGLLAHNLPGTLENVVIFVVTGQQPLAIGASGRPLWSQVSAYRMSEWAAGDPLDMALVTRTPGNASEFLASMVNAGTELNDATNKLAADPRNASDRLNALAFFSQFAPPEFQSGSFGNASFRGERLAQRAASHGWDLGRWFTQPCVIIVGQLGAGKVPAECPTPLYIDGTAIKAMGRTVVRWVYPLPASPPRFTVPEAEPPALIDIKSEKTPAGAPVTGPAGNSGKK